MFQPVIFSFWSKCNRLFTGPVLTNSSCMSSIHVYSATRILVLTYSKLLRETQLLSETKLARIFPKANFQVLMSLIIDLIMRFNNLSIGPSQASMEGLAVLNKFQSRRVKSIFREMGVFGGAAKLNQLVRSSTDPEAVECLPPELSCDRLASSVSSSVLSPGVGGLSSLPVPVFVRSNSSPRFGGTGCCCCCCCCCCG